VYPITYGIWYIAYFSDKDAYLARARSFYGAKQYVEALGDVNKMLEFDTLDKKLYNF
jgi:hypothetical protein